MSDPYPWIIIASSGGVLATIFSILKESLLRYSVPKLEELGSLKEKQTRVTSFLSGEDSVIFAATILKLMSNLIFVFGLYKSVEVLPPLHIGVVAALVLGGFLILLVVNELIPKVCWAAIGAERIVLAYLPVVQPASRVLTPIHRAIESFYSLVLRAAGTTLEEATNKQITDDILSAAEEGEREGLLEEEGADMIESIIEFQDSEAHEIMTPRTKMVGIDSTTPIDQVIEIAIEDGHSRFPVYSESIDQIEGILYVKDLLKIWHRRGDHSPSLSEILRKPTFIPESKMLSALFRQFKETKVHIAIVLDEYGGTAGLITVEDIVEEIVGEIEDEYDQEVGESLKVLGDRQALVEATVHIDEINETLNVRIPESEDFETIGGFLFAAMGKVPTVGENYVHDNLEFTIVDADQRRINRVKIAIEKNGSQT